MDWLYFTGKLPKDPLGRLFSTVGYSKAIIFSSATVAETTIDTIRNIHMAVENARGAKIPDWAFRDVLFMLIHYSIAAYELFERRLSDAEKEEIYNVFYRMGVRMDLQKLPLNYTAWIPERAAHLNTDLQLSVHTTDLYLQYKKHLGSARFQVLLASQKMVVPPRVKQLLHFSNSSWLGIMLRLYKLARSMKMDWMLKNLLLPQAYRAQVRQLDVL